MEEMKRHRMTVGVFGIPADDQGRGLWSKRRDKRGLNAIGGAVDPQDAVNGLTLSQVLKREFLEETGLEIEVGKRPLGVFSTVNLGDLAVLFPVEIVGGKLQLTAEATEHLWLTKREIYHRAKLYDEGDHENGLLSGVGKRQWRMAMAFFYWLNFPDLKMDYLVENDPNEWGPPVSASFR